VPRKRPRQPSELTTTYIDMDAERIVGIKEQIKMYGVSFFPKDGAHYRKFHIKFNHRIVAAGTWEFSEAQVQEVYLVLTSKPKTEKAAHESKR